MSTLFIIIEQKMIISNIVGSGAGGEIDVAIVELDDAGAILQGFKGKAIISSTNIGGSKNEATILSAYYSACGCTWFELIDYRFIEGC